MMLWSGSHHVVVPNDLRIAVLIDALCLEMIIEIHNGIDIWNTVGVALAVAVATGRHLNGFVQRVR